MTMNRKNAGRDRLSQSANQGRVARQFAIDTHGTKTKSVRLNDEQSEEEDDDLLSLESHEMKKETRRPIVVRDGALEKIISSPSTSDRPSPKKVQKSMIMELNLQPPMGKRLRPKSSSALLSADDTSSERFSSSMSIQSSVDSRCSKSKSGSGSKPSTGPDPYVSDARSAGDGSSLTSYSSRRKKPQSNSITPTRIRSKQRSIGQARAKGQHQVDAIVSERPIERLPVSRRDTPQFFADRAVPLTDLSAEDIGIVVTIPSQQLGSQGSLRRSYSSLPDASLPSRKDKLKGSHRRMRSSEISDHSAKSSSLHQELVGKQQRSNTRKIRRQHSDRSIQSSASGRHASLAPHKSPRSSKNHIDLLSSNLTDLPGLLSVEWSPGCKKGKTSRKQESRSKRPRSARSFSESMQSKGSDFIDDVIGGSPTMQQRPTKTRLSKRPSFAARGVETGRGGTRKVRRSRSASVPRLSRSLKTGIRQDQDGKKSRNPERGSPRSPIKSLQRKPSRTLKQKHSPTRKTSAESRNKKPENVLQLRRTTSTPVGKSQEKSLTWKTLIQSVNKNSDAMAVQHDTKSFGEGSPARIRKSSSRGKYSSNPYSPQRLRSRDRSLQASLRASSDHIGKKRHSPPRGSTSMTGALFTETQLLRINGVLSMEGKADGQKLQRSASLDPSGRSRRNSPVDSQPARRKKKSGERRKSPQKRPETVRRMDSMNSYFGTNRGAVGAYFPDTRSPASFPKDRLKGASTGGMDDLFVDLRIDANARARR